MTDEEPREPDETEGLWPPSPKMQILLIGAAFFAFNALLIVIWAIVWAKQF